MMSDRRTGMPVETDDVREEAAGGAAGYRGERAQDRATDDPELRREVDTVDGPVEVEDSSGSQHVEAERVAGRAKAPNHRPRPQASPQLQPRPRPQPGNHEPAQSSPSVEDEKRPRTTAWQIGVGFATATAIGAAAYVARLLWNRTGRDPN
jgi:hypothetical protein